MAQVLIKQKVEEEKMIGYCSECDCKVVKSRCGCDEECPQCGEWLDWDFEENEEEPKEYWYEPKEGEW